MMKYITNHPVTWATVLVLLMATWFQHYWIWGVLFLWWSITSYMAREAFIGEIVTHEENPPLFYVVTLMWLGFGAYYIVQDFAWRFFQIYIG